MTLSVRLNWITTNIKQFLCGCDFNRFGRVEIAKLLLQRGANPLVENENNFTPLHLAARVGHTEICSLLLKNSRVQVNSINQGHFSPFHLACLSGSREACELFLKSGADIALKSKSGFPPLQISAWKGHEQICQLLIETGTLCNYYSSILAGSEVVVLTVSWTFFLTSVLITFLAILAISALEFTSTAYVKTNSFCIG